MHWVAVPEGTKVFVGIAAVNKDKSLWGEDALEWKPDRWLSPLPESVTQAHIPGVYSNMWVPLAVVRCVYLHMVCRMTFLGGGRACMYVLLSPL